MPETPVFTKVEADRILKRAGEIEGADDSGPITAADLRSIASEAGFGAHAVERAIAEAQQAGPIEVRRPPVQRSGLVITHLSTVRALPIEISSEQLMRAVRLFQPYRDGAAQLKLEEDRVTWRDRKGLGFTVSSGPGVTEIRVLVSKPVIRKGRWAAWVKAAADRLETLIYLVVAQDVPAAQKLGIAPPENGDT